MPYSVPSVAATAASIPFPSRPTGRTGHRRSYSHIIAPESLATTSATGAFSSLGSLPTRRRSAPSTPAGYPTPPTPAPTPTPKRPTFQLGRDDDDDSPDESPDDARPTPAATKPHALTINTHTDDDDAHIPPLRLKSKFQSSFPPQIVLHPPVPFPRSSPLPSPVPADPKPSPRPIRPSVSRTSSSPILLSNGKPLKSSLKSSSSSPNIPFPPQSLVPSIMFPQLHQPPHHQRARSAPSTPHLGAMSDPMDAVSAALASGMSTPRSAGTSTPELLDSPPESPTPPQKNVHFPSSEEGGLTTVKLFNRSARPASLLRLGDETETETEGESSSVPGGWGTASSRWGSAGGAGAFVKGSSYPFPRFGSPGPNGRTALGNVDEEKEVVGTGTQGGETRYEIDMSNSTPIPARGAERADANVYFESLGFVCEAGTDKPAKPLTLTGTVLVRNIAFQKTVTVRFTLDDWHTTNDVLARHEKSLRALPERFLLASLPLVDADASPVGLGATREVVCRPYGFEDVLEASSNPEFAWDRFRYDIALSSYESTLDTRTMFFVGRYMPGVGSTSEGGGVVSVQGGDGREWWDNNCGLNYRVGFVRRVGVGRDGKKEEEEERRRGEKQVYKRAVVMSAPPVFSPAQKSYPSPPQISSSQSFPSPSMSSDQRQQQQQHHAALTQSTLSRLRKLNLRNYAAPAGSGYTGQPITAASFLGVRGSPGGGSPNGNGVNPNAAGGASGVDEGDAAIHARAISTSSVDSTSSLSSISSLSTTTSTDSTPVHTPTLGSDDEEQPHAHTHTQGKAFYKREEGRGHGGEVDGDVLGDVLGGAEEDQTTPTVVGASKSTGATAPAAPAAGFPETVSMPVPMTAAAPTPGGVDIRRSVGMGMGLGMGMGGTLSMAMEMGTSPPFSMLDGLDMGGRRTGVASQERMQGDVGLYWPWGSLGAPVNEDAKDQNEEEPKKVSVPATELLEGIKEKNISSRNANMAGGPLMPPRRKQSAHHPHAVRGSPSASASASSGSGSGSDTVTGHARDAARWKRGSPPPPPPRSESPLSFLAPAAVAAARPAPPPPPSTSSSTSTSTVSPPTLPPRLMTSPQPWPLAPAHRPQSPPSFAFASAHRPMSPGPVGGGAKRFFPPQSGVGSGVNSPRRVSPVGSSQSVDLGFAAGGGLPPAPGSAQDDAVYQAFVRQWCFAQGPGPAVGTTAPPQGVPGGAPGGVAGPAKGVKEDVVV